MAAAQQRCRGNQHQCSIKTHAARSSRVTPAVRIARSTVSWCAAGNSTNGRRIAFPMRPILATAHFTGMGFASTNSSLCRGCKLWSMARAIDQSLQPLHKELFVEANPIPVKWAVARMGLIGNAIRLPLVELPAAHQDTVLRAMRTAGVTLEERAA